MDIIVGGNSKDTIVWNDELHAAFDMAQKDLSTHKAITLHRPSDRLWMKDEALRKSGLGATLYVGHEGKPPNQRQWLPCEIEALVIPVAIKHSNSLNCQPVYSQTANPASNLTRSSVEVNSSQVSECLHFEQQLAASKSPFDMFQVRLSCLLILPAATPKTATTHLAKYVLSHTFKRTRLCNILPHKMSLKLPFASRAAWLSIQSE